VIDEPLIVRAVEQYRRFSDKTWGLVDCASFVVMRERGITEAFTSDYHFEQAGFKRLLSA
jgi:predicted nucleic acid-binding protein